MVKTTRTILTAAFLLVLVVACAPPVVGPLTVTLIADGQTRTLETDAQTVRDLLLQAAITLDENDRVSPAENTFLTNGLTVQVIRVDEQTETEEQILPYSRETVRDTTIPVGQTRLLRAGVNGIEELHYTITFEDGVEISRRLVQRVTVRQAQNEVVLIGAHEEVTATPISGTVVYLSAHNAWVMRTTTGNRRRLTTSGDLDGRVFDLSPDGTRLLVTRTASETGALNTLWMVDTVTAGADPLRLRADDVLWAGWSPDSEQIAFSTSTVRDAAPGWEANNDLIVGRPRSSDGQILGRREALPPSAGGTYGWWGTSFAWSPAGSLLAYARADEVGVVRLADGDALPLAQFSPYRTYAAWAWTPSISWSPDGLFVATVVHGPALAGEIAEDSPIFDLHVLGVAVDEDQAITRTLDANLVGEVGMWAAPSFSPDGNWIVLGRARIPYTSQTSTYDLYVMDRDGSERRLLFPTDSREPGLDYPVVAWDPWNGRLSTIYRGDLYLVTVNGEARRITDDGSISAVRWAGGTP